MLKVTSDEICLYLDKPAYEKTLDFFSRCESCKIRREDEPLWLHFEVLSTYSGKLPSEESIHIRVSINHDFMVAEKMRLSEVINYTYPYPEILLDSEKTAALCKKEYEEFKSLIGI